MSTQIFPGRPAIGNVTLDGPLSGFGELETVSPVPTSQVAFVYGLNPLLVTTDEIGRAHV